MSFTYMSIVNEVLGEMNEVLLTSSTFASATNIQLSVKNFVNRAYWDINNPEFKWPWLSVGPDLLEDHGNVYVEVSAGTRWNLLKTGSSGINDDYGHIDWENFLLTTEGVSGETSPYTYKNLTYLELEEWKDWYSISEALNKSTGASPKRVIRSKDGRYFGLSPIPDKTYRVYFYAWDRPSELSAYNDTFVFPDQYKNVLISRARYYAWQRKENEQQAAIALQEYEKGLRGMKQQELNEGPDAFTDDRIRFI